MPTAPSITSVTANLSTGDITVTYDMTGAGDHNQLWRSSGTEYGGALIKIADPIPYLADDRLTFSDYQVASGVTYSYQVVAVDGSGVTAASTTKQTSLTLSRGVLHSVIRPGGADAANADEHTLVYDLIPHNRSYNLAAVQYQVAGADILRSQISAIEQTDVNVLLRVPLRVSTVTLAAIRAMVTDRRYVCYRDTRGNKFFGHLAYDERYETGYTDLLLSLQVLDFQESIT